MYLYLFFVVNYFLFIFGAFTKIPVKAYIAWILIVFSVIAFCYDPTLQALRAGGEGVDLCRHFDSLENVRVGNYDDLYIEAPLSALYIFIVAELFDNNHFLPLISVLVFYGISIYIILKICNNIHTGNVIKKSAILLFTMTYIFFGAMNNIRYPISMAMFFMVLYYELILQHDKAKIFYIIPCLMHPGILLLVLTRIFASLKMKYTIILIFIILPIVFSKIDAIFQLLINISSPVAELQALFVAISYKFISYSVTSVYSVPLIYKIMSIYSTFLLLVTILLAYNYFGSNFKNSSLAIIQRMNIILVMGALIGLATNYMEGNFTDRLTSSTAYLMTIMYIYISKKVKLQKSSFITVRLIFISLSSISLAVYILKIYPGWILLGL